MFKYISVLLSTCVLVTSSDATVADYLQQTHVQMSLPITEMVHVVLGNQSADMDSIVSSIAFASANRELGLFVPLINIQHSELPLRRDVMHLFEMLQIDSSTLLYKEDLPLLQKLAEQECLRVTLVDHNQLAPNQEFLKKYVERIFDHRPDANDAYPLLIEKRIMPTKSNATLIAENLQQCSPEEALLLLSAILLDTKNLNNVTEKDMAMAERLKELAGVNVDALYATLFEKAAVCREFNCRPAAQARL